MNSIPLKYTELVCPYPTITWLEILTPDKVFKASITVLNFLDSISSAVITSTFAVTFFNFSSDFVALEIVISSKRLFVVSINLLLLKSLQLSLNLFFSFLTLFFINYLLNIV